MTVWIAPIFQVLSQLRMVWTNQLGKQASHDVLYYLHLVEYHIYAMFPIVHYKTVHAKFNQIRSMLEAISHNSLFCRRENFWKTVSL